MISVLVIVLEAVSRGLMSRDREEEEEEEEVVVVVPTEVQMGYIPTSLTPVQRVPVGSAAEVRTFAGSREVGNPEGG